MELCPRCVAVLHTFVHAHTFSMSCRNYLFTLTELEPLLIKNMYTERKKKHRVNLIPKFHSSLKKFVKYFTMITKRYMYGTKVPNFIGL